MLNAKNEKPLRAGQVFTVSLGVSGLTNADATDARAKTYALQVQQLQLLMDAACLLARLLMCPYHMHVAQCGAAVCVARELAVPC